MQGCHRKLTVRAGSWLEEVTVKASLIEDILQAPTVKAVSTVQVIFPMRMSLLSSHGFYKSILVY